MSENLHKQGLALAKENKYAEALTIYSQAINSGYVTPDLLNDRGVAYIHTGDKLSAFNDFTESKNLQPDYSYRYACLAFIKEAMGDLDGAIEDYEYALKLDPADAVSLNNLGLLQEKKGYTKEAKVNFDQADNLREQQNLGIEPQEPLTNNKTEDIPSDVVIDNSSSSSNYWTLIKSVFTNKQARKEFIHFLKKGFRAK
jgi:tetratricopeptide (TPR) repeat protein